MEINWFESIKRWPKEDETDCQVFVVIDNDCRVFYDVRFDEEDKVFYRDDRKFRKNEISYWANDDQLDIIVRNTLPKEFYLKFIEDELEIHTKRMNRARFEVERLEEEKKKCLMMK